jgi:hypothetical protein
VIVRLFSRSLEENRVLFGVILDGQRVLEFRLGVWCVLLERL